MADKPQCPCVFPSSFQRHSNHHLLDARIVLCRRLRGHRMLRGRAVGRCEWQPMGLRCSIVRGLLVEDGVTRSMCGGVVRERVWIQEDCFGRVRSCVPWLRRWELCLSDLFKVFVAERRVVLEQNVHESLFVGIVYLGASTAPSPLLACRSFCPPARAFSVLVKPTAPSPTLTNSLYFDLHLQTTTLSNCPCQNAQCCSTLFELH